MKKHAIIFIIGLFLGFNLNAQNTIMFNFGLGATLTDVESLAELDGVPEDWGQFSYTLNVMYFRELSSFELGAEIGYHYLYWYTYRVITGAGSATREWNESITKISFLLRTGIEKSFKYTGGLSVNIFENGAAAGIVNKAAYHIPLSETLDIPVGVRLDLIFAEEFMLPFLVTGGVNYRF